MAYDEGLAQRIRELLEDTPNLSEKKMFGGVAFLVNGSMAVGIIKDELMVRVGPEAHDHAIAEPHARPMDFTGRTMRGFVQVAAAGFEEDAQLRAWLARGVAFAAAAKKKVRPKATQRAVKKSVVPPRQRTKRARKPRG